MKTTDFSRTLIRCSSIGQIMTSPQGKSPREKWLDCKAKLAEKEKEYADLDERKRGMKTGTNLLAKIVELREQEAELFRWKDVEPLSQTAKSYLAKVYAEVKYGKRSMQQLKGNKYTEKGKLVEEDGIDLVCLLDRRMLTKNDIRVENEFLTGEPDLYVGESIYNASYLIDIKCPYDIASFLDNLGGPLNPDYYAQIQGYMALCNCPEGEVSYCLVSAPVDMVQEELRKAYYRIGCVTEEDERYKKEKREIVNNMTFEEIPPEHRRLKFHVTRDQAYIDKVYQKVEQSRKYLSEIERMHLGELLQEIKELETA
jgi:hypothetical protein